MAADNGKKKSAKGVSKKDRPEPRNWSKIALQAFIVLMMLMAVLAFTINRSSNPGPDTDTSSTDKSFNGITDGLRLIPANASYARFVDLKNDSVLSDTIQNYYWLYGTLPSEKVFDAKPQRDLFAIYPRGNFGDFTEQFVSLTDFGKSKINLSYPDYYNVQGVIVKRVNNKYYYSGETKPVVSGRIDNVAPTIDVMFGNNASAFGNYSGIFEEIKWKQVPVGNMTLEMVGRSCNVSYVDGYYAGIGPADRSNQSSDRLYNYTVVMHINQTLTDQDREGLALLEGAMEKMGFKSYRTQAYEDFIIIEAEGGLDTCIDDMLYRWGFIKYSASV